jgi:hypothetical protein
MSKEALAKIVQRAISDGAFRRQLSSDPGTALRGFDLSADEAAAVRSGDPGRLSALGVDLRMSKAFVLSSDNSPMSGGNEVLSNDQGMSYTGATTTVDQGAAGSSALISGDASDTDAMITTGDSFGRDSAVIPGDTGHTLGSDTDGELTPGFDSVATPGGGAQATPAHTYSGDDAAFPTVTGGEGGASGSAWDNVLTPGDPSADTVLVSDNDGVSGAATPGEASHGPSIQE